ncbi:ribosome small subunit-dependent GTPase A [Maliponia aquimaris]|uniref:Small ribosomal subunit biogenesis GTPase RsgA n=1 Tax=Maliponia aquimaris TaxID=1673631 RepID=A0A238KZG7_9RHOB|nr:ribosome small subunit-dependent GTPase A [Maliponia aquimaris]SMX48030.1 Putative ribosome biogenesis GTPase RsgA [Maliponia aquimaris]
MTRDDPHPPSSEDMPAPRSRLETLGWNAFFAGQVSAQELELTPPVRVTEVHRSGLRVLGDGIDTVVPPGPVATVGDWLLLNRVLPTSSRVLERKSLFQRRTPGKGRDLQLIAANVDTAFVVSSCNQDFNVARLERYVAMALEAGVPPVIVLTKVDLCPDPEPYLAQLAELSTLARIVPINARSEAPKAMLGEWCGAGQTVVFLGSSGVGKSTLVNALLGDPLVETAPIREDDARGRHTTTHRHLHFLPSGCAVLDTPGMRELQLAEAEDGIADTFADITALAGRCKFNDCAHESEPGCAIRAALDAGELDTARVARWRKLLDEEKFNTTSLAERKSSAKALRKTIRAVKKKNRK